MKFHPFPLSCECGLMPARIKQVGLSDDGQLVIHWWCLRCRKAIYVVKDLGQPNESESAGEEIVESFAEISADTSGPAGDASFLERMGIRFLADGEA
jgi:hypothetical protein